MPTPTLIIRRNYRLSSSFLRCSLPFLIICIAARECLYSTFKLNRSVLCIHSDLHTMCHKIHYGNTAYVYGMVLIHWGFFSYTTLIVSSAHRRSRCFYKSGLNDQNRIRINVQACIGKDESESTSYCCFKGHASWDQSLSLLIRHFLHSIVSSLCLLCMFVGMIASAFGFFVHTLEINCTLMLQFCLCCVEVLFLFCLFLCRFLFVRIFCSCFLEKYNYLLVERDEKREKRKKKTNGKANSVKR